MLCRLHQIQRLILLKAFSVFSLANKDTCWPWGETHKTGTKCAISVLIRLIGWSYQVLATIRLSYHIQIALMANKHPTLFYHKGTRSCPRVNCTEIAILEIINCVQTQFKNTLYIWRLNLKNWAYRFYYSSYCN